MLTLKAEKRDNKVKADSLRRKGFMPAVFYGKKEKAQPISISMRDFEKVWKKAGESSVITLTGDFGEKDALLHDLVLHPLSDEPIHADFYVFEKGQKVRVKVPVVFEGISPAV